MDIDESMTKCLGRFAIFKLFVVELSCVPGSLLASQIKSSFESTGEGLMDNALKEMRGRGCNTVRNTVRRLSPT
jgi:hypothetical protein